MHTTNYFNTFIEVADDCPISFAEIPPIKSNGKTVANLAFEMLVENPYEFTSDDVLYRIYATRNEISQANPVAEREKFFSKGQPCFRASPLGKRYGWGVHSNSEGKIAIYAIESSEYKKLARDENLKHVKAMRSKK
jgi:hypothetical protein